MRSRRFCRPPSLQDALPLAAEVGVARCPPAAGQHADVPPRGDGGPTARRILALHLPWLATERLRIADRSRPVACWAPDGSRRVLTAVNPAATAAGLRPAQAVADAQAILPEVVLIPADPGADAAWLRRLALWALCITPLPAVDPPDGLLLDVTGVAHLHGDGAPRRAEPGGDPDEAALLRWVVARFARVGVTAHGAIAGNPPAAAALARGGRDGAVVPPGGERAAVVPLPLAALRLDPALVSALHRLGLRRVGDVLQQPRGPLARRFGAALVDRLDAATGARGTTPIAPLRRPPEFAAARDFPDPIATREAIDAAFALLLPALCRRLEAAGRGARRLVLLAFRVDGEVQAVAVGTGLASRDARHFARLFRDRLERLAPGFGFERMALEARATEPVGAAQASLPGRGGTAPEARRQALAQLLDRLAQRLPIWRLAPRLSHWPEQAVARLGPFEAVVLPQGWPGRIRPPSLLRRPVPLQAVAVMPDGPPARLWTERASWRVARAEGPERIEPEWWRDRPDRRFRDYYRVELATGARLWVCRSGPVASGESVRWWLHGRFG
jgi:protein ImuB